MTKQEILNSGVFTDTTVASNETLTAEQLLLYVTDTSMCGYFAHNNIKESVKPLVKEIVETPVELVTIEEVPVAAVEEVVETSTESVLLEEDLKEEIVEPVVVKEEKPIVDPEE